MRTALPDVHTEVLPDGSSDAETAVRVTLATGQVLSSLLVPKAQFEGFSLHYIWKLQLAVCYTNTVSDQCSTPLLLRSTQDHRLAQTKRSNQVLRCDIPGGYPELDGAEGLKTVAHYPNATYRLEPEKVKLFVPQIGQPSQPGWDFASAADYPPFPEWLQTVQGERAPATELAAVLQMCEAHRKECFSIRNHFGQTKGFHGAADLKSQICPFSGPKKLELIKRQRKYNSWRGMHCHVHCEMTTHGPCRSHFVTMRWGDMQLGQHRRRGCAACRHCWFVPCSTDTTL